MSMYEAIKNFNKQFEYDPKIENEEKLGKYGRFVVTGMGGSHLAADLLKAWDYRVEIKVYSNYGLPNMSNDVLKSSLVIVSSYSGNTEEIIESFKEAQKNELSVAVVAVGGKLIELAKEIGVPYIQMPDTGIQPRSALGFSFNALLKLMGETDALKEAMKLTDSLNPVEFENTGHLFAEKLKGHIPVIYSSERNEAIAYNWKIKFNETGKIPAFYNVFPELNHNEMTGFDVQESSKELSKNFYFILLKDSSDHPKVIKRMEVLEKLYRDRGLNVEIMELRGKDQLNKIFSSLVLADWIAYYTAEQYGLESEQVPMVEEFKKLIIN